MPQLNQIPVHGIVWLHGPLYLVYKWLAGIQGQTDSDKKTFGFIDHQIHQALWRLVHRRRPRKSTAWREKKYFRSQGARDWIFTARNPNKDSKSTYMDLFLMSSVAIRRHTKIRVEATPYVPAYTEYFKKRQRYLKL
ncbi:TPA: hypothetical protein GJ773_02555 [Legionella pneumophila]|uniref:Uncharacterized protein n=2 Tax=Legionella TaxID=445 RepID=A0A433JJQ2_9GAMM|nr:group II intron maturase-specific domain-containing protein [Legionella pneumophila]AMQ28952.1 hypothetical protein lpt_13655 [Legionella pneumophila subsp. pneumophila]RUQ88493.1 hypothetical protein EKM59_05220 [Legionella septentrionalis]PQM70663.1 hypothetical protein C3926_14055 [Legionella pneumophila]RYW92664.1 hypothetical protein D7217_04860 [Legionella pneumophila]TIG61509.1 hypothetical protein DI132_12765 [Legionella pneumophila]